MESIYILIPLSIVLVAVAVAVFFWATNNGQFEDLDTPAWRILRDDEPGNRQKRPNPAEVKDRHDA